MYMAFLLLLLVVLIAIENSKLKKENVELKERLNNMNLVHLSNNQQIPKSTQNTQPMLANVKNELQNNQNQISLPKTNQVQKKQSPSALFIIGSILVIFASIIFLSSSWMFLPGIIKAIILIIIQFIFGFLSKMCLEKFSLDKASKAFKYIFFAFIPVVLLSFSFFELVGYFLSIGYDGFTIYISLTFILTSLIYKYIAKKEKDLFLNIISVICEILSLTFAVIFFEADFFTYLLIISIYNIIISVLLKKNYLDTRTYKIINQIMTYGTLIFLTFSLTDSKIISHINVIIYTIYFLYNAIKSSEKKEKEKYTILSLIGYTLSINTINILLNNTIYIISLIAILPLFLLNKFIKEDYLKKIITNGASIITSIILIFIILNPEKSIIFILSFLVSTIIYIIALFLNKNNIYKYLSYFSFLLFLVAINYITEIDTFGKYIPLIVASVIYLFESILPSLKDSASNIIIILLITLESVLLINSYSVLIPLILLIIFVITEKENDISLIVPILCALSIIFIKGGIVPKIFGFLASISLSSISIYKKKINQYSILSLIYFFTMIIAFDYPIEILFLLVLIWSIAHFIINKGDSKFYKITAVISSLGLYTDLLIKSNIEIISLYAIGCYLSLIYITRYIIKDDFIDCKFIEYYGFSIITIISLINIEFIFDGLLLTVILIAISFLSYALKYNSYFKVSNIFIFINLLFFTSKYLFQIPWYIYILIIGCAFLSYAIYDEKRKKQESRNKDNKNNNE